MRRPVESAIELEILERNGKKLRNLHIQEARLQRQRAKDIAALKLLIQERHAHEAQPDNKSAKPAASHPPAPPSGVSANGFVFENSQATRPAPLPRAPVPDTGASQPAETEGN